MVYPEYKQQSDEVESSKDVLAQADVNPMVGDVVKSGEDIDKAGRIPVTSRCTFILHNRTESYRIKQCK